MAAKTFAINDEIAMLDSNNDIHYGVVTAVSGSDVTVSIPTLRSGKGYIGGFAVERLHHVEDIEMVQAERIAEIKAVKSMFAGRH